MRRISIYFLILTTFCLGLTCGGLAQDKPSAAMVTAPATGPRAEFLQEVAFYEQRFTRLAEAMPAEKYAWRPGEGVRSVGEVYAHIAAANYGIARALGTPLPVSIELKAIMASSTDKQKTIQALKDSFAHLRRAVIALSDADADKPQEMFGQQSTQRGSFIMIAGHTGEHLGQSIAYARMNGVVPPWTEEMQQQQQKPGDKPKR